jgi:hypothetical protein
MRMLYVLLVVCVATACKSGSLTEAPLKAENQEPAVIVTPELSELAAAYNSGALKFEVRGLKNEAGTPATYGTSFAHKGVLVATGTSERLVKAPMIVVFDVIRTAGGDPALVRAKGDQVSIVVREGMGDITISGGYRTQAEKWEPEQIELRPFAIMPMARIQGPAVRE